MMERKSTVFLIRLTVVFLVHCITKMFDLSFSGVFEWSWRSMAFSFFYLCYWLLIWYISGSLYKKLFHTSNTYSYVLKGLVKKSLLLLAFGLVATVVFNILYHLGEQVLFDYYWENINFLHSDINPEHLDQWFYKYNINPELVYSLFIIYTLVYWIHLLISSIKHANALEIKAEKQKRENAIAQYSALRNQIEPHFFLNTLSVLSSLIHENNTLSIQYITHLSKLYRSVLETDSEHPVALAQELELLNSYIFLIKIRHQDYIEFSIALSEATKTNCYLLSHSLQMLAENAIKHNLFTKSDPLRIELFETEDKLVFRNNIRKRTLLNPSTQIGLRNIRQRYQLIHPDGITVSEDELYFCVYIPKLNKDYEYPNF
jgi:two-component system LytT family sensor kinase